MRNRNYEYAEKTYLKARKMISYPFYIELGNVFSSQRKYAKMINEYLDYVNLDEAHITTVQNRMSYFVENDFGGEFSQLLRVELFKRIQSNSNIVYNRLLIWLLTLQKDFENAVVQAKALDRRTGNTGEYCYEIGMIALDNLAYDEAENAFEYVLAKNKHAVYYHVSQEALLRVMYLKITEGNISSENEIKNVEARYLQVINEMGIRSESVKMVRELAHLQAFYLNAPKKGMGLLESVIAIPALSKRQSGICKIELGDIKLMTGDQWDATLIYAQAEKENRDNETGYLARYKKALLAYYTGNFQWSLAQLKVLKGNTTKLIANDALELSLLISENMDEDSLSSSLQIFAHADFLSHQKKDSLALLSLDSIIAFHPSSKLMDNAYYKKGILFENQKNYTKAVALFEQVVADYSYDLLADNALYRLAKIYDYQLNDKEKAMAYYKQIMVEYSGSIFVIDARKRFRLLRGDKDTN